MVVLLVRKLILPLFKFFLIGFVLFAITNRQSAAQFTIPFQGTTPSKTADNKRPDTKPDTKASDTKPGDVTSKFSDSKPAESQTNGAPTLESKVSEAKSTDEQTDILRLRDKNNQLVPIPNLSYEEFLELLKLRGEKAQAITERPQATVQQLTLVGSALSHAVELIAVFDIQIHEDQSSWLRVPLGLREAAWQKAAEYKGDGEQIVHFDREADEYVCWLKGKANSKHQITAHILVPFNHARQENRLQITLPWAGASSLQLTVPNSNVQITQSTDTPDPTKTALGKKTRINVVGLKGNYTLGWRELDQNTPSLSPIFDVTGLQLVRIDSRSITTRANLRVKSSGAEFDTFHLRLPPKSSLSDFSTQDFSVSTVPNSNGEIIEIKLEEKKSEITIPLQAERNLSDIMEPDETIELAGFEVPDALPYKQGGYIGVQVVGDLELTLKNQNRLQPVAEIPVELAIKDPNAKEPAKDYKDYQFAWEYFGQPFSLETKIVPRRTHIHAEVEHRLRIGSHRATLDTTVNYRIRGAKVNRMGVNLRGWVLPRDGVKPASIIDYPKLLIQNRDDKQIPLFDPVNGDVTLQFQMHFDYRADNQQVIFPLPTFAAESIGSTILTVTNNANVSFEPIIEKNIAFVRLPNSVAAQNLQSNSEPANSLLRYRVDKQPAQFAAKVQLLSRHTSAVITGTSEISSTESRVQEKIELQAQFEPITQVKIYASESSFFRQASPEWKIDGVPLTSSEVSIPQFDESKKQLVWTLKLPESRIGIIPITVDYQLKHVLAAQASTSITLPILLPEVDQLVRNEMTILPRPDIQIGTERIGTKWIVVGPSDNPERLQIRSKTLDDESSMDNGGDTPTDKSLPNELILNAKPQQRLPIVVERAWLQTELIKGERQERAVYKMRGPVQPDRVTLPVGVIGAETKVFWNGQPVAARNVNGRELALNLETASATDFQVLELRYRFSERASSWSVTAELPSLQNEMRIEHVRWQVITPVRWHLMWGPGNMDMEANWEWNDIGWERTPSVTPHQLEEWSGGLTEAPLSSAAYHYYLFSGIGKFQSESMAFTPRSVMLWLGAIVGFGLGWLVWSVKQVRHPLSIVAIGVILLLVGASFPDPLLILGQAGILGIPLVVMAALIRRTLKIQKPPAISTTHSESKVTERSATQLYTGPTGAGSAHTGSTATKGISQKLERPVS